MNIHSPGPFGQDRAQSRSWSSLLLHGWLTGCALCLLGMRDDADSRPPKWAGVISAGTLEAEILVVQTELEREITTPAAFVAGGHKQARVALSELAMLFTIVADYDGPVRYRKNATAAALKFSKAATLCKVGTTAAYQATRQCQQDLAKIVAGEELEGTPVKIVWPQLTDRKPLMQVMHQRFDQNSRAWSNDERLFAERHQAIAREAELVAAIATVIRQPGMPEAEEPDYLDYAEGLSLHAGQLAIDARQKDFEQARRAIGKIQRQCSLCHEDFRAE